MEKRREGVNAYDLHPLTPPTATFSNGREPRGGERKYLVTILT